MPESNEPTVQSFLTLPGLNAYGIVLTEQQYLALCALVDNYTCACLSKLQQAITDINTTKQQAITDINNAVTQATAAVSTVDVGSNANIQYIADNCANWTDGQQYTLPSGLQITYRTTITYVGNESA